jgi:predicted unusual protein kinase regulating ubiquinone biosynthesis (AarF/ABC1/UbiB family)
MGILNVIEAIMDMNVDNCVDAFIQMGVLASDADLDKVRAKVKDNFETGKMKVKFRRRRDYRNHRNDIKSSNSNIVKNTTQTIKVTDNITESKVDDSEIVGYFSLPAEYAFVARAISQMDGVGKGLDSEFDFISAAAPYLVEVKGSELYFQDEAKKILLNTFTKLMSLQNSVFGKVQDSFTSIQDFQQDIYDRIKNN